ncbi:restriction endonuclease subunit S [Anoxybacillus sp. FSL W8-0703]|uniref:restriction endonuclease subunit S n=1 Tax=Anoxybacillus sp. FSL W8-0703 TaxID=2954704 RepID=UPI0030F5AAB6
MRKVSLGSLVNIRTGKLDANASNPEGKYPFFTCSRETLKIDTYSYDCECVLVAGNGDLNVKYYNGKFDAYQRTYIIESIDKNILNVKYLYYFMQLYVSKLRQMSIGGVIKYIKLNYLTDAKIPLPNIEKQNKIVKVLEKAQELIDKRKAQIEALDQLTQSVFLEMFGDPWINPKKWRVKKIKEVIKNKPINGFFAKNEQYSDKGNAKIIWISDFINKRSANIHGLKKVVATEEDIKKYQVKYGDILFCRSSLNVDGIGKAAYVPEFPKDENIIFECHIIKITLSDEVLPEFFQVLSETKFFRNQIIKHSKTSTMTTISQSGIMECSIIVPPVQIQNQFLQILKKIEYEKQKLQNSLSLLNDNFNSLMQRAFKGELFNDKCM